MDLLAAEMMAKTGRNPGELYRDLTNELGSRCTSGRMHPRQPQQKTILSKLSPDQVNATELAGDKIVAMMTTAPGNGASIGGLKVVTDHGWFAARPSGTEDVYKLYAESFRGKDHLRRIQEEAQSLIAKTLAAGM
jgi:Phosphoglucomutase